MPISKSIAHPLLHTHFPVATPIASPNFPILHLNSPPIAESSAWYLLYIYILVGDIILLPSSPAHIQYNIWNFHVHNTKFSAQYLSQLLQASYYRALYYFIHHPPLYYFIHIYISFYVIFPFFTYIHPLRNSWNTSEHSEDLSKMILQIFSISTYY